MGTRGPGPRGGYPDKTSVLSTRITGALRKELKAAAARSKRSLSSEIEHRLRRSFDQERDVRAVLGGDQTYAFLRTIADVIRVTAEQAGRLVGRAKRRETEWLHDPYVYDQATRAAIVVIQALRPPGEPTPPRLEEEGSTPGANVLTRQIMALGEGFSWGPGYALHLLRAIRDVPASGEFPLPDRHKDDWTTLAERIAADLGPIKDRLQKDED
jgi:hypothetical protein